MANKTDKKTSGTSFYDVTFDASVKQIIKIFGEPSYKDNCGNDKVNFEWDMETIDGDVFTIYDWKEYRKLKLTEIVEWHIGANSRSVSMQALDEILELL
jgi:hypothetical protein